MWLLINNYMSEYSLPSVVSVEKFKTKDEALEAQVKEYEDAMANEYCEYGENADNAEDKISVEYQDLDIYVIGPDFTDWWTIIEIKE